MTRLQRAFLAILLVGLGTVPASVHAGGAEIAEWTVDGPIDRTATSIPVLVTERACNSGEDAIGRIATPVVVITDAAITVTMGVVPRSGAHDCQSNPPTPFVLELPEPLGTRALLDGGSNPPVEIVPAGPVASPSAALTPADAAARAIASDPRFAGIRPLDPQLIGQSAWYEAVATPDGFLVTITIGWGDCPAGCIERHTWQVPVSPDGVVGTPAESGDTIPPDLAFPTGSGDVTVDLSVVAGPTCAVETDPTDPSCEPRALPDAEIAVRDGSGTEVARLTTDADGRATATLPTGTYVLEPLPVEGTMGTPEAIAVSLLGPEVFSTTFSYDTGIR